MFDISSSCLQPRVQINHSYIDSAWSELTGSHVNEAIIDRTGQIADGPSQYLGKSVTDLDISRQRANQWPYVNSGNDSPLLAAYEQVRASGLPNMLKERVILPSALWHEIWDNMAVGHSDDAFILAAIRYGFPLQYVGPPIKVENPETHNLPQTEYPHISDYLHTEVSNNAIIGPFDAPPFEGWFHTSPIMTREKADPSKRRIIVDLSYPPDNNVNHAILKNSIFGIEHQHTLPSVDHVVKAVQACKFECTLATIDIQRAYRNFRTCPMDYPLLGVRFRNKIYIDTVMPFGARNSSMYMQKIAMFIVRYLASIGIESFMFLDDMVLVIKRHQRAHELFANVLAVFRNMGLPIAYNKLQAPTLEIKYLGVCIDIIQRQIAIPVAKIEDFLGTIHTLLASKTITKRQLQSLVGKVNFMGKAVKPARLFMSRILETLRQNHNNQLINIDTHMIADLRWFRKFLSKYNGRSIMHTAHIHKTIYADSCLTGGGATDMAQYYELAYPTKVATNFHITILEALNCLIALRVLLTDADNHKRIMLCCDNLSAVYTLTSGRAKDPALAAIARAAWYVQAARDIELEVIHVPGAKMGLADALSRAHTSNQNQQQADSLVRRHQLKKVCPHPMVMDFSDYI